MNYTLNQLQIFLKVSQTQSITKAAEELHLTQPAVSIQLKNFQDQFPIPLSEVVGRQLYITDFGKEVAVTAQKIIDEVQMLNQQTLAYKGKLVGKLKISAVSTGKYIMPYFLADFVSKHQGVELLLDVTNKAKVIESLKNNEVDFSLVSVLPHKLPIEKLELMQNKLYLVGNHQKIFKQKMYSQKIFEKLPLIYREQGSGTRYTMERFIEQKNLPVTKKMELTSNEAVKQAVIAGLGYSILPLIGIKNELLNQDLQIIPVKGFPIESIWHLIWLRSKNLTPVAQAYLHYIAQEKQKIIESKFSWYEGSLMPHKT
ncbi:LysR family transcriptional regulator [Microscilla marina]|uniref:CmpR n=1 Tax=Microscilla marina ATCC 23134 TaxID=313606 RepID=A1ZDY4_MICM2|nr:LysR family transcriptional regulator [Microscilla marina]EAY31292.1 CmpR [Microscilla marina ATCC 23134]